MRPMTRNRKIVLGAVAVVLLAAGVKAYRHRHELRQYAAQAYRQFGNLGIAKAFGAGNTDIEQFRADEPFVVYDDRIPKDWKDWTWKTDHSLKSTSPVYDGSFAISLTPHNKAGVWLRHKFSATGYGSVRFYIYGDSPLEFWLMTGDGNWQKSQKVSISDYATTDGVGKPGWKVVNIPFSALGFKDHYWGGIIGGLVFKAVNDGEEAPVSLDDITLQPDTSLPATPTAATVNVTVDLHEGRHPISQYIYGMNMAPPSYVRDLRLTVNRWGGNDKSRYNWALGNAENAARDWDFRNRVAAKGAPPGPSGAADAFIDDNHSAGAETLMTIPMLGWVAKDSVNHNQSHKVPWTGGMPVGNGDRINTYDPTENRAATSVQSFSRKPGPFTLAPATPGPIYQDEWVNFLKSKYGGAAHGGIRFYGMDNEPDIWGHTHTDVHPVLTSYDELLSKFLDYSDAVKAVDPDAVITGPVLSGWTGYKYSELDRGKDNYHTHADTNAHGGDWFLPWFLKQVREHDRKTGKRSLDVLDVHYYPQSDGVFGYNDDPDTQTRRLRAPRSLFDPKYHDESWVPEPIRLIPRLQGWVDDNYPGTKIAITEWNFGVPGKIDGGLADADALGIFGRESVYMANFWAYPLENKPGYYAFKLYRNADGAGHGFGDTSVSATTSSINRLTAYAGVDSATGAVTVMLINKMTRATVTVPLEIKGLGGGMHTVVGYQVTTTDINSIHTIQMPTMTGPTYKVTVPPYSMTLLRISGHGSASAVGEPVATPGSARREPS